jgi:hypothetical protein
MTAPTTVGCPTIGASHREHTRPVTATSAAHSRHLICTPLRTTADHYRRPTSRATTPSGPNTIFPTPAWAVCTSGTFPEDATRSMRKILASGCARGTFCGFNTIVGSQGFDVAQILGTILTRASCSAFRRAASISGSWHGMARTVRWRRPRRSCSGAARRCHQLA